MGVEGSVRLLIGLRMVMAKEPEGLATAFDSPVEEATGCKALRASHALMSTGSQHGPAV